MITGSEVGKYLQLQQTTLLTLHQSRRRNAHDCECIEERRPSSALPLAPTPLPPVVYGLSRISKEEAARSRVTRNTCPHPSCSCSIFSDLRHFEPSIHIGALSTVGRGVDRRRLCVCGPKERKYGGRARDPPSLYGRRSGEPSVTTGRPSQCHVMPTVEHRCFCLAARGHFRFSASRSQCP